MPQHSLPKIGVLLSAGGSAFETAVRVSNISSGNFHIVTDRDCGAELVASRLGISNVRVVERERRLFSRKVAESMKNAHCEIVLLHFSRLVSEELYDKVLTFNVHPSLLPAFAGLDGVGDAAKSESRYQGATLHIVDGGMDTGPIIAQTCRAVPASADLNWRSHLAYMQKVIVTLALFDLLLADRIDTAKRGKCSVNLNGLKCGNLLNPAFSSEQFEEAARSLFGTLQFPLQSAF